MLCPPPPTEDSVGSTEGWGYTPPPFPYPAHTHTLPPRPRGQGTGDGVVRPPPVLRGARTQVVAQSTIGGNGGALLVATAAGLSSCKGAHSPPRAGLFPLRAFVPQALSWGEGGHNHPFPARPKLGRPANVAARQGVGQSATGQVAQDGPHRGAGGGKPLEGRIKVPVPAHQGGGMAPVLAHRRASGEVT